MIYNTSVDWHQQSLCISEENLGILPGGVIQGSASLSLRSPTCLPFTVTAAQRLFLLLQLQGRGNLGGGASSVSESESEPDMLDTDSEKRQLRMYVTVYNEI